MHEPYEGEKLSKKKKLDHVVTIIWSTKAFSTVLPYNNNDNNEDKMLIEKSRFEIINK